jgi:alkylhydroperoxidase/carboxymuconolactone decarboxylase family protein YurZ
MHAPQDNLQPDKAAARGDIDDPPQQCRGAKVEQTARQGRDVAKAPPSVKRDRIKNFTPALVDYTNDVVDGDLWECKCLSKRGRSLTAVAALVATYRPEQLVSHLTRAINGATTRRSPR